MLIARTEGNPFFLEESIRTLVETGVLVGEPGAYRLAQALPTIQVPATVQAVLAARIDRLPPEEKQLLQTAAVIGTDVPLPLLQAIADVPDEALHRGLAYLQAAEFLYETRLFPEHGYTFKHALTHEVAYGSLLQERRHTLHARIVTALEAVFADRLAEQVEVVAYHALRGELWDKALAYFRQAGNKALERSAHREATAAFQQAMVALHHLPESRHTREQAIDLHLDLRTALISLGEVGRVFEHLCEANTLALALDDPRRLARVSRFMAPHYVFEGDYEQAIMTSQRALSLATACGDLATQIQGHFYLGYSYYYQGEYRRAIESLKWAMEALKDMPLHERFGQALPPSVLSCTFLARCLAEVGLFDEGMAIGEEGLRIAETVKQPVSLLMAHYHAGVASLRRGVFDMALSRLERAVSICQGIDLPVYFPDVASALGAAYTLLGGQPKLSSS